MRAHRIEWPTMVVVAGLAGSLAAVFAWHDRVPVVIVLAALGILGAWYNSLQHEVIHGHPSPWRRVNTGLAVIPLGLVVSFSTYRDTHLAHHRSEELTDPERDPESFYVTQATWDRSGPMRRSLVRATQTLAGRMVLGPFVAAGRWARVELTAARTRRGVVHVLGHVVGVAAVLSVVRLSGMDLWVYIVGVAWAGGALSLMRSFAEHRMVGGGTRSAVVRAGRFFSLLYLNNNLHHTHHAHPGLPWFELPQTHERLGSDVAAAAGAGLYQGYGDVARRFLFRPMARAGHPGN